MYKRESVDKLIQDNFIATYTSPKQFEDENNNPLNSKSQMELTKWANLSKLGVTVRDGTDHTMSARDIFNKFKNTINEHKEKYSDYDLSKAFLTYIDKPQPDTSNNSTKSTGNNNMSIQGTIQDLIGNGTTQIILTGAPGTGKTFMAKNIATNLGADLTWKSKSNGEYPKYEFVQFHPSYDYTDFVEGLRPVEDTNGNVNFKKIDGIFKKFCRDVVEANNSNSAVNTYNENTDDNTETKQSQDNLPKYFFIIDEINRANLSKVLGELMFGLEKDKRGKNNLINTQYQNLPTYDNEGNLLTNDVFKNGFYIPENVIIIGTMNDIDRSVESMDFALRRRFTWYEVDVTDKLLKDVFNNQFGLKTISYALRERINFLNKVIKDEGANYSLNKHYFISQGYFANLPEVLDKNNLSEVVEYVWEYRLKSLISEYVRGESDCTGFIKKCENAFLGEPNKSESNEQSSEDESNE